MWLVEVPHVDTMGLKWMLWPYVFWETVKQAVYQ